MQRRARRLAPQTEQLEVRRLLDGDSLVPGIHGTAFLDVNDNGWIESGEPVLPSWLVYLDANNNGNHDAGEMFTLTDEKGEYHFVGLAPGKYTVRQEIKSGWTQTLPASGVVQLSNNETNDDFARTDGVAVVWSDQKGQINLYQRSARRLEFRDFPT